MTDRPPGFYWLRDKGAKAMARRESLSPNPSVAYWSGVDWEFIGSDWNMAEDDEDLNGVSFRDRFEVVGDALNPPQ